MTDPRRTIPSVSALLAADSVRALLERAPRRLVADAVRQAVDEVRRDPGHAPRDDAGWGQLVASTLESLEQRSLRPLFNATGVVLHTNLGRAPLPRVALAAIAQVASGYSNLEYDLEQGTRGSRYTHCAALLRELTGAEDALVVNNGASALVLALNTFAEGRDAVISRGELVEIGGSFRVPDILARSGARLIEVGTTNRTHLDDYRRALTPDTGALLKVHRSNFTIEGFVASVSVSEMVPLAAEHMVPVLHDLGSGLFLSLEEYGLRGEPLAAEAVREGATVISMSGDKLLGGPQAGILLGRADAIARMRRNPLARALRVDKLTLAALEATLTLYRDPARALREIPALAMLAESVDSLRDRARSLLGRLDAGGIRGQLLESEGSVGGGAFPAARLASIAVAIDGDGTSIEARLRDARTPVIGRIANGRLLLDLRSIPAGDDESLAAAVLAALG